MKKVNSRRRQQR